MPMNRPNFKQPKHSHHLAMKKWQKGLALFFLLQAVLASKAYGDPQIRLEKSKHDFGTVEEGIDVSCNFLIHNDGNKTLLIKETKSTCGCTVAAVKRKAIPSKSVESLKVVMDTSMKQGIVNKEITIKSNDPKTPIVTVIITANVQSPHQNLGNNIQAKIFKGRCYVCHVKEGIGKVGEDLYLADCAMCHGFTAKGGVAPSLLSFNY
ncbi:MAG: DUF1573 domain-containing protein, partial [Candidatus Obscuribacterales bacterium]|nr:DUF1573 domain-containing protein [Candidatus Obscuribacterales bacterium]